LVGSVTRGSWRVGRVAERRSRRGAGYLGTVVGPQTGLLGETPTALPTDRELSGLESSIGNYLVGDLTLGPLNSTWPQSCHCMNAKSPGLLE